MSINRDTKILEAILFASGNPVLEEDLKEKMINKKNFKKEIEDLKIFYESRGINLIKTGKISKPSKLTVFGPVYIQGSFTPSKDVHSCSIEFTLFVFL